MGNAESNDHHAEAAEEDLDPFDGIDTLGYRVLGVQPNSPASKAGLVSFLDFLVGANDKMLLGSGEGLEPGDEYDDVDLPALLAEYKDREIELLVWNIKSQQARLVRLTPSDRWGGAGLLGVTIRLDNYAAAEDRLVRVLTVEPNSPAAVAGLVPLKDFLLGTTHQTLETVQQLATVLQDHADVVVELYVYNTDSDLVRVVALMPTLSWGGGGLLGAEVGTGYLHRLPHANRATQGASVERKVRYVPTASSGKSPSSGKSAGPNSNGSSHRQTQPLQLLLDEQEHTVLELEPQLEMEPSDPNDPSDHGYDEEEEEQVVRAKQQQQQTKQQPQQQRRVKSEPKPNGEATTHDPTKNNEPPGMSYSASASQTTSTPAATTVAPPVDATKPAAVPPAVAVFSQPPQVYNAPPKAAPAFSILSPPPHQVPTTATTTATTATTTNSSSAVVAGGMLPPPPKMHYYTPSSNAR